MYVIAQHEIKDPPTAFDRGKKLVMNEGAPPGVRGLQFFPSRDGTSITCLWEADSVESVQGYVDATLGEASANRCYEVDEGQAFAERPSALPLAPSGRPG